ncbi:RNA-directed DNA polymerase, eukaryota, reverse transcriptase zinc-binding domain protein [Tanacetum coccineum]
MLDNDKPRFRCQSNDLWEKVIKSLYVINGGINDGRALSHSTWDAILSLVKRLKQHGIDLLDLCTRKIGNGALTSFWNDSWNVSLEVEKSPLNLMFCFLLLGTLSFQIKKIPGSGRLTNSNRLVLNKLPTRVNLERKGIDVDSTLCPICGEDVETVNYIFSSCEMAKDL